MQYCHVYDSFRHVPLHMRFVKLSQRRMDQVVTSLTLPVEHERVLEAGFFSALNTVKLPMTHIISKVINIRCQARKFSTVTLKLINNKNNPEMPSQMRYLLLCSLLGNYAHCSNTVNSASRIHLYNTFVPNGEMQELMANKIFCKIMELCPLLIVNVLRDFLIDVIEAELALKARLQTLMHLQRFTSIVNEHMARIRVYFTSYMRIENSSLRMFLSGDNEYAARCAQFDINRLLGGSHSSILKISYRRPNLDVHQFLMGMRKRHPMVMLPDAQATSLLPKAEDNAELLLPAELDFIELPVEKNEDDDTDELFNIEKYLMKPQAQALQDVMNRCNPLKTGALKRFVRWLKYFGVEPLVIQYIDTHVDHYHYSSISTEQLKVKFSNLQKNHPHAYNLLQLASEIIKSAQKHYLIMNMPRHLILNQLQAARERVSLQCNANSVLQTALEFVYCRVCRMVYSLLRDFKSVYNVSYKLGLRDAVVEYIGGEIYCRRDKTNSRGCCKAQPLTKLNLLGKILAFQGKLIMLCPQQACCAPMVIDSSRCNFTDRGIACKDCTEELQRDPPQFQALKAKYKCVDWNRESCDDRKCLACNKSMAKHTDFFMYPFDTVICSAHSNSSLQTYIAKRFISGEVTNAETLKAVVMTFFANTYRYADRHARQFEDNNQQMQKRRRLL